jgi:hypothetical protein
MPRSCHTLPTSSIRIIALLLAALVACLWTPAASASDRDHEATLQGTVKSGDQGLHGYRVSLYGAFIDHGPSWRLLGSGNSDRSGYFSINYSIPSYLLNNDQPLLFVEAENGTAMLASCIGPASGAPNNIVVNERTTVATGNAFAQFVGRQKVQGNFYGMKNAADMLANFSDPATGAAGIVLGSTPNGTETSTYATFNSLANVVASCVADSSNCSKLFAATTPRGQQAPANVLQALANLVKYPWYPGYPKDRDDPIYRLSLTDQIYQPVLAHRPTNWLLFLKITGGFYSTQDSNNLMNGPGNFAIDRRGFVWVDDNYQPQPPGHFTCAGTRLVEFTPSAQPVPGTPFTGGGLSGAGWGTALDPDGYVWVANFGFQDPPCQFLRKDATHDSVSKFRPDGNPVSPSRGFTEGAVSYPMGTASDQKGNIWIANCGNDTITRYARGDQNHPSSFALGPTPPPNNPQIKPFGISIDLEGNIWVTDNHSSTVSILSPQGKLIKTIQSTYKGITVISHPIGNAVDSRGNIWVANSDWLDAPCPTHGVLGTAQNPSVTLLLMNTQRPHPRSPFTGGGLTLPWGVAVDGNDTVWAFNFGVVPPPQHTKTPPSGISHFCGVDTSKCPAGLRVGDPISPSTGYRSNAFQRITAGAVDPSGNIWITTNWRTYADPFRNPGGNSIIIAIGAAGPLQTPLIGPPVPFVD